MTQSNLLKLAKQGNAKALAAMLNRSLQPKSITAKVGRKDDCLQVLLESAQTPDQEAIVSFIRNGLIKLEVESIKTVKVYGRQTGEESPAWSQQFEIVSQPETPSSTEESDFNNLLTHQTRPQTERPVPPKVETPSILSQTDFENPRTTSAISEHSPRQLIEPLSVGNVVSSGLVLYRSHFKSYFGIALLATLWTLLPFLLIIPMPVLFISQVLQLSALWLIIPLWLVVLIYCLAKYFTNAALISRLGIGELLSKPESVKAARSQINPHLWSFFWLAFFVGFLLVVVFFPLGIIAGISGGILGLILAFLTPILGTIVNGIVTFVIVLGGMSWLYSRLMVSEVVLAVEDRSQVFKSIKRSWDLSHNSAFRLIGVVLVAFVVTLPMLFLSGYLPQILFFTVKPGSAAFWTLYFFSMVLNWLGVALVTPFWQTLKAVVYYDLRSRREGLGLQLRDSPSR